MRRMVRFPDASRDLASLALQGHDWRAFASRAVEALTTSVPADAWCIATADPATGLMTAVTGSTDIGLTPRFFELEYGVTDYLSQGELARSVVGVDTMYRATEGRLERSVRWRELLEPFGIGDQLRAALVTSSGCWGFLALMRERSSAPFSRREAGIVQRLRRPLADGLRGALVPLQIGRAAADRALLLLADDYSVIAASSSATALLGAPLTPGMLPPPAVLAVAARAATSAGDGVVPAESRMRTAAGWVTLSATALRRASSYEVAIIVERARPSEVVDLKLDAYGLTGREQEVVRAILAGDSTAEIARRLYLSPHTVQQHLKSIFTKTGVNSRRAVVALIFAERYQPSIT